MAQDNQGMDSMRATISARDLGRLLAGATPHALIDIRDAGEYEAAHLPRATSVARRDPEFRARALVPRPWIPLVVYDDGDGRADLAARTLADMGYTDVRVLAGGLGAWRDGGAPVETGVNVPSKAFGERLHLDAAVPDIEPTALHARLAGGERLVVLDVRTPEEYGRLTIPGAVSVPNGELALLAEDLRADGRPVVVHCMGRTRSIVGCQTLRELGVEHVVALRNGTMGWQLAGFEPERGAGRPGPAPSAASRVAGARRAAEIAAREGAQRISHDELAALAARHDAVAYVVDVRSGEEYAAGHVPGSHWVPGGQAVQRADDVVAVRAATVVFVCDGGARSSMTAAWFRRMGHADVRALDGGTPAWAASGRTLDRGMPGAPAEVSRARDGVAALGPAALAARLGRALVLDVSTSVQHEARHVPGARWVSRGWLELVIDRAASDRQAPIVVTCAAGDQSVLAAATLRALGYTDVAVLDGGVRAWAGAGRPVEQGIVEPLVEPRDVALRGILDGDRAAMVRYLDWEVALTGKGHRA